MTAPEPVAQVDATAPVRVETRPLIGASWKMNLTPSEVADHLGVLVPLVADLDDRDLFVLPAFPSLAVARDRLAGSRVAWGAQDVHHEDHGPWTGEVSAPMLADLGCRYVEVGHSERRRSRGETPELVGAKVAAVVRWGMVPIICVGDGQRADLGQLVSSVLDDLARCLGSVRPGAVAELVVAYEPAWAIGLGMVPASPEEVVAVHRGIRAWLEAHRFGSARIIYGGSVDASSAPGLLALPGVDGLFVGRASLDPRVFASIARTHVVSGA